MTLPTFTMRELLQAGIHFGHHPRRWNPKMAPYLFGVRNNVHIINLEQTVPMLYQGMKVIHDTVAKGGRLLFVGTKPQASNIIADAAKRCGQYYVNHRWLGGMMTNWKTVSKSIKRLDELNEKLENSGTGFTKKEVLQITRERDKLERAIGGIKEMGNTPDVLFVIDTNKEDTAIKEANKLGIPVIAVVDSNCDPNNIDYPIPGNDDALRAIRFYCDLVARTVIEGLQTQMSAVGVDLGASAELPEEELAQDIAKAEDSSAEAKDKKAAPKTAPAKKAAPKKSAEKADDKEAKASAKK